MHTILRFFFITFFTLLLLPTLSYAAMPDDKGSALQFQYEIIELNSKPFWILQHEDQMLQIQQKTSTIDALMHYQQLIEQASTLVSSVFAYSLFILSMLAIALIITFTKPTYLKHPLFTLGSAAACLVVLMLFSQYEDIVTVNENLRYYFLLLENINSPN